MAILVAQGVGREELFVDVRGVYWDCMRLLIEAGGDLSLTAVRTSVGTLPMGWGTVGGGGTEVQGRESIGGVIHYLLRYC